MSISNIIKITGFDPNNTKRHSPKDGEVSYAFNLQGNLTDAWKKDFNSIVASETEFTTCKFEFVSNMLIKVICSMDTDLNNLVENLKKIVDKTNKAEDDFAKKLQNIKF